MKENRKEKNRALIKTEKAEDYKTEKKKSHQPHPQKNIVQTYDKEQ